MARFSAVPGARASILVACSSACTAAAPSSSAYPDYLVSPMARQIVVQVVRSYCSKTEVPNPVRMDTSEAARVQRFGKYTAKYSSINIIKNKLINYERWQKRWYVESKKALDGIREV